MLGIWRAPVRFLGNSCKNGNIWCSTGVRDLSFCAFAHKGNSLQVAVVG